MRCETFIASSAEHSTPLGTGQSKLGQGEGWDLEGVQLSQLLTTMWGYIRRASRD